MTPETIIVLAVLAAAIVLFVSEWLRVDVVALGVLVALMLSGILSADEALAGFANPVVLTIAALFVVGGAITQTGLADLVGRRLLSVAGASEIRLLLVITGASALLSAFMSNTGAVAVLLPAIVSLARNARVNPSRLLMPLTYGSMLGGALTLIGTPPNLIAGDLLRADGLAPLRFFDYTPIGLILLAVGAAFLVLAGRRLLPDHQPKHAVQRVETPEELVDLYRLPEGLFRLRVRRGSGLLGRTVVDSRLGQDFRVTVLEIQRAASAAPRAGRRLGLPLRPAPPDARERPSRDETPLAVDDLLLVQGTANDVSHAAAVWNLALQPAGPGDERALFAGEIGLAEVLLPPRSSLAGKTIVGLEFGTRYHLTVLGIHRPQAEAPLDLKTTVLHEGDTLLVQGPWPRILALKSSPRDFVVIGEPEALMGAPARRRAPIALLILAGMLVLMVSNAVPLAGAALAAALAMILTGCVTIDQAYDAVDWKSIVLIAGMLPMSTALERAGLVNVVAQGFTDALGPWGPLAVLAGLFLLTALFTQVLSNTATAVLIAPVALAAAHRLGADPHAFIIAVALAASMAFATPVASPTNTLVMGAGDYRFRDYLRVGTPMILVMLIATLLFLPLLWPL